MFQFNVLFMHISLTRPSRPQNPSPKSSNSRRVVPWTSHGIQTASQKTSVYIGLFKNIGGRISIGCTEEIRKQVSPFMAVRVECGGEADRMPCFEKLENLYKFLPVFSNCYHFLMLARMMQHG